MAFEMDVILRLLTLTVLVMTIDAQWEGMGDVRSARYEPALLPPCPTIRVLSTVTSKIQKFSTSTVKETLSSNIAQLSAHV